MTHPDIELLSGSAMSLCDRIKASEISSRELVETLLRRIEDTDPEINAFQKVLHEEALRGADQADRMRVRGESLPVLHGLPVTVKADTDVAGSATTQGVPALRDALAKIDAPAVAHLRAAGAIPIGRTNLPDFGLRWHTDSALSGPTLNPWDPGRTPGGSTGGEAAAIATGMSVLGVGSDLGGSLRWPAQCTGVTALRPTLGRIPQASCLDPDEWPITMQLMEVRGPLARTAADLRAALRVMSQPSLRDPWHTPMTFSYGSPPRRAIVTYGPGRVDPEVRRGIDRATQTIADAGWSVEEGELPRVADACECWARLIGTEIRRQLPELRPLLSAGSKQFLDCYMELVPELDREGYASALSLRQAIARDWAQLQADRPLIVAPVSGRLPFRVGEDTAGPEAVAAIVDGLQVTLAVSLLGLPAVAAPIGTDSGLPQGVQLIGPRWGEELCIEAAESIEAAFPSPTPPQPSPVERGLRAAV